MTLLLTPDTLAAIKARPSRPTQEEKPRWAGKMRGDQWARAYGQACALLDECIKEAQSRTDGTETAAILLSHALDLVAHGIVKFSDPAVADPRKALRLASDETLRIIWNGIDMALKEIAGETETALRAQAEREYSKLLTESQAALDQERDMAAQIADAAYAEAAAARQQVAALEAQLKAQQQLANKERYDLSKALEKARQPSSEVVALRARVVDLERQNKQLSQSSRNVSQPEVTKMPEFITSHTFSSLIDAMSFCASTRGGLFQPQIVMGRTVAAGGADLTGALNRWRNQVVDPRGHVRGVVAARLERVS